MARVIRLPDPSVFQRKPLIKDPTQLSTGTKGMFNIVDAINLADKIVKSEGVGSVASAIERGLEPSGAEAKTPIPESTDALRKAAEARTSMKVQGEPEVPAGTAVRQAAMSAGVPELAPRPERRLPSPTMAPSQLERQMVPPPATELPAQAIEAPGPVAPREAALTRLTPRKERMLVRNTREAIAAGGPPMVYADQLERSPQGVVEQPKVPPLKVPGPAAPQTPQVAPSVGEAPTPAPEQLAATGGPARAVSMPAQAPAEGQAQPVPPSGETPPLSAPGEIKGTRAEQAKATARQVVANIQKEAERGEPAAAAVIDMTAYQASQEKPISVAQFYSGMIEELKNKGYYGDEESFEIPQVVSVEGLIGLARQADTGAKQKAVLDAFANNTVTGMGYTTLAQRLSGDYRKPYLQTIISSFPKKGQDVMSDIYKLSLAYQASGVGAGRYADIGAGKPQAGVQKTLAEAGRAAAGGQLTAEKAVTERETRTAKVQNLLAQGIGRLYKDAVRSAVKGTGKRAKVNLPILQRETTGRYDREQARLEQTMANQEKEIVRLEGIASGQPQQEVDPKYYAQLDRIDSQIAQAQGDAVEPAPLTKSQAIRDPAAARENAKAIQRARQAQAKLRALESQKANLEKRFRSTAKPTLSREQAIAALQKVQAQLAQNQGIYQGLLDQRARFSAFIQNLAATGRRPTPQELLAYGMDAETAMQMARATIDLGRSRRQAPARGAAPRQAPAPQAPKGGASLDQLLPE